MGALVQNEYAALFVALIGQGPNPQGVVNTSEGKVVRAFHRFTLVDQTGQGRDLSKGRMRDAGAVKISCAGQDPNARNCHGYRKFVKRSILEEPARGFLVNDTIIIKYIIELVVSSGGALSRSTQPAGPRSDLIRVPSPNISADLAHLLASGDNADFEMVVEDEVIPVHKVVLCCRSEFFKAMLCSPMREGQENRIVISDIKAPVICERRLCETIDVATVATTLTLAEQNSAEELKKVCLEFVSRNLAAVMQTDGYKLYPDFI
ncbi:uncharacterized protein HaLaN_13554 [Haematococcus lacustris]|uniref:BTB domain-containing protein n=1 Tax=Haematococcus lacustris TaxID=44745 RepID=A0A699Z680_HAELA|nr:uncharacterized protein HaLaN_13554 [Haematococcus lacustris]